MDNKKKKFSTNRVAAYALSGVMLASVIPYNVFANAEKTKNAINTVAEENGSGLGIAPAKGPVGVKDAAKPEDTTTSADAKDAVHGYVGVLVGGDINADLAAETGQRFKPIEGVKVYFQWYEAKGNRTSPTYYAVSGADGQFHIKMKPYIGQDGKLVKFDADTTSSAGSESYKMWVDESTIPEGYQLQYSTGEGVEFTERRVAGGGFQLGPNRLVNYRVLLMEKQDEAKMHKEATPTGPQIFADPVGNVGQGAVRGKVSWDYESAGGVQWGIVSTPTSPAEGVTVTASYLSDYALKQIYSADTAKMLGLSKPSDIRGSGWTFKLETQLQEWIAQQVAADKDKWIAETVSAVTNAEGDYKIQFKGTWGPNWNDESVANYTPPRTWSEEEKARLGTVAENAKDGSFLSGALSKNEKHINSNWLFISTKDTDDVVKRTPWNYNWYTGSDNGWGIHGGWAQAAFGVSTVQAAHSTRADFNLAPAEIKFNITNFDTQANTATPGDVAKTNTQGLPYKNTNDSFKIVWYDQEGKKIKEEPTQKPTSTGALAEGTFDTKNVKETKTFIAKLHYVDSKGNLGQALAQDAFTVKVGKIVVSAYDDVNIANPAAKENEGATYKAEGLPEGLTIDKNTGTVSGKAKVPGKYTVTVATSILDEDSGEIMEGTSNYTALVTDSPLEHGEVGVEYNKTVKPSEVAGYVFKNISAKFIDGKAIDGLTIAGDQISGKPTKKVEATQEDPNVEVTYDIYKLNEKGEEVLIKKGHVDKVPLSIKDGEATNYEPKYEEVDGKVGTEATVKAPTFTDKDGKPATPKNVTYELGEGAPTGAKVNADGSVTYTPVEADAEKAVKIPVVVKYSDGSTDNVNAVINVTKNATTADKVKELGGLNPQTIKVWKGDKFDWAKGVVAADDNNSKEVKALLDAATITDKAGRNSNEAGKSEGTLLVTFADGSSVEVPKQMLIVSDHIVTIDPNDPNAPIKDDLPSDKIEVKFVKSTGVKEVKTTGTTYVKPGITFKDSDFPEVTVDTENGYDEQVTWTPANRIIDIDKPGYVKRGGYFRFVAKATLEDIIDRTNNPEAPTPDGYVRVTFTNGDGVNDIANNKVYDVKSGTALTADKYPEVTAKDGYENPTWSVAPGTAITADNATITATATMVQKDNEKYEATGETITKNYGEATEEAEVLGKVTTDYPADAEKQPTKALKAGQTLPDGKTSGNFDVVVEVTYPDGTKDEATVTVKVAKSNAETYEPTVEKETVKKGGTVDLTDNVTNKDDLPEGTTIKDVTPEGAIDTETPGDYTGKVEVTYPDGSKETVDVPVTVTEADNETYEATGGEIDKEFGKATEEAEVLGKVTTDYPADAEKQPTKALKVGQTLPDGKTSGNFDVVVEVTYPDGTKDEATVTVKVAKSNAETYEPTVEKETVKKGGTVDLTDNVTNKDDLPEGTTVKDVTPEGAIDTETPGDYTGKVEVTYPDGSKETVDVPVTVTEADNETYEATGGEIDKEFGKATEEAEVLGKVTTDYPADAEKQPTKALKAGQTLPDGKTSGNFDVVVEVTYPDGTKDEATVTVKVAKSNAETYEPTVEKETVKKGGTVDLTDNVTNKDDLPEGTTVKDVTPEGAIDTETPGDYTGKVEVTYPDGSKETVDVPVTVTEADNETYEATGGEIDKEFGKATEEAEVLGKVTTDYPADAEKQPTKALKAGQTLPDGKTSGNFDVVVEVTYPDGTKDEATVTVKVAKSNAETYEPTVEKETVKKGGTVDLTDNVTNKDDLPEGTTVKDVTPEGAIDTETPGDYTGKVEVTYPDGSKETVDVPVTVTEADNETYEATGGEIDKEFGKATEEAEVLGKVTTDYPADAEKQPTKALKAGQTLPDGKTSGNFDVVVEVTYPDGTKDEATVTVKVAKSNAETYEPTVEKETVKKGGTVDLTDNVTNKDDLPEGTTVKDVTPEGTIDTKVPGDYTGKVEVTYPDGSKETVDVPVTVTDTTAPEKDADKYQPEVAKEEVKKGGTVDLKDNVTNLDKLPKGTTVKDVTPEGTIDTKVPGDYTGKVEVTYPDGSKETVDVPVTVTDTTAPEKDSDKYEPTVSKEEVNKGGKVDLTDNVTNLDKLPEGTKVEDVTPEGAIDTETPGDYTGKIKVTYPDGSSEEKEVPVTVKDTTTPAEKDADKYEPTVKKEEVEKGGKVDLTDNVTNLDKLPEGTKVEDVTPEGAIDTETPGDYTGKIKVTYPDGSSEEKEVPVTVKDTTTPAEKDADKYEPTVKKEEVEKGGKVDLTDNVTNLDKLPEGTKVEDVTPEGAIDTETPGDYTGKIKVTYPDGSSEEKEVPVTVKDTTPTKTDAEKYPAQDPNKTKVEDKNNLTDDEKDKVKEEVKKANPEAKDVIVDDKGNAELTYPDGSKNTIPADKTVTEKENGSTGGDDGYRPGHGGSDVFDRLFKRHDYTPTYPVKTVVPEKTEYGTPVRDTLWYVFHINEFEYEVVRNGVVTKRLMDVTPVLQNDRTMLPLRYVAEALQADVKWDAKTRTATFTKDGLTASIQIDSDEIVLSNGKTVKMDSKPLNINDRILVSVTNVANVFGLTNGNTKDNADQDIEWEQQDKSATIYIRR
ncbi:C protein alpha-antigen precursor [Peptoniphilus harei]|uniref:Rib/alpha-like domain-containing protein n=1 Tax=Peptoniphilus harei TaxID=54005 RepID=UPI000F6B8881|nr:Rib/alpha-like domain-containing protein [Peptoniphilus harei]QQE47093.1 YPDG domain-containing protein [Peptoniphilus harei]VEJ34564.1 C protein alpha-antigen precursor [Peptoniphilus harei]